MTQMVGEAKVQVTGDLGAFASNTESGIRDAFDKMGTAVEQETGTLSSKFGQAGTEAGSEFSTAVDQAAAAAAAGVSDTEPDASAIASNYGQAGDAGGTAYSDALVQGVESGSAAVQDAADGAAQELDAAAAGSFGEAGTSGGEAFSDALTEGISGAGEAAKPALAEEAAVVAAEGSTKMREAGAESGLKFKEGMIESIKGVAAAALPILGALAGGELIKNSVEAADQLEGANIRIENVFGESGAAVKTWAKGVSDNLRISSVQAETSAGQFGAYLSGLGVGQDQAAGLSEKLVGLTQNIAAFNNADPASVEAAVQSALRGRSTALKQYGVTLTAAQIQQEAVSHGLVDMNAAIDPAKVLAAQHGLAAAQLELTKVQKDHKSTQLEIAQATDKVTAAQQALTDANTAAPPALNAQQKALATMYALMDNTQQQQTGLAKTSDTLKAKQQIMRAEWTNMSAELGAKLLPILADVAGFITKKLIPGLESLGHWVSQNESWLKPLVVTAGLAIIAFEGITLALKAWEAIQAILDAEMEASPLGLIITALAALAFGLYEAYQHSETFREIVQKIGDVLGWVWTNILQPVADWFMQHWKLALEIALLAIAPFIAIPVLIQQNWGKIVGFLGDIWGHVTSGVTTAKDDVMKIFNAIITWFAGVPGRIANIAEGMWDGIGNAFKAAINFIIRIWDDLHFHVPGFSAFGVHIGGFDIGLPHIDQIGGGPTSNPGHAGDTSRAAGGRLNVGQLSMVGEKGYEIFNPDSSGDVIPHDASAAFMSGLNSGASNALDYAHFQPGSTAGPSQDQWDALIDAVRDAADGPRALNVDGTAFAQIVNNSNRRSAHRL